VSRPWREQITVLATPAQLHVSRRAAWWQRGVADARWIEPCGDGPAELGIPAALLAVLARCRNEQQQRRWMPRPLLRLVLSHHLAPLTLVPHARALQDAEERQAAARHAFAAVYGAADTADWQFVVDEGGAGDAALAAGLDLALVEGLRRVSAESGVALGSIEPLISAAIAAGPPQGGDGWLVIAEAGRVVLARHEGRAWRSLRTHRPRRGLAEDLGPWIEQARLIDGIEGLDRIAVVELQRHELQALQRPDWTLTQTLLPEAA